ncbi:hypothetical protein GCM10010289_04360 [Streptomyces violascens]|uniref:Uncharacterized protein n=1 Tax=Streptomyces violascens TaxID=67381 RepID=A0ABQ3QFV5_9ACTN|nr:hypothetical protein GCM10010289_04360 [Streptomyces violascens]GHI36102.1 hypothetical protein Sviol_05100 [Streptomyces violascens]
MRTHSVRTGVSGVGYLTCKGVPCGPGPDGSGPARTAKTVALRARTAAAQAECRASLTVTVHLP